MNQYQNILLPVDFSESNVAAAARAQEIATANEAKITLIHIVDYLPPSYITVELPAEFTSEKTLMENAKTHLAEWSKEHGLGDCNQVIKIGKPKKLIVSVIEKLESDLVILSPHNETGLVRLFGSVTNAISQHCKCDVLIVRSA